MTSWSARKRPGFRRVMEPALWCSSRRPVMSRVGNSSVTVPVALAAGTSTAKSGAGPGKGDRVGVPG